MKTFPPQKAILFKRCHSRTWRIAVTQVSIAALISGIAFAAGESGSLQVLDERSHHLAFEGDSEWKELDGKTPEGRSLQIKFTAKANAQPATLLIRQRDVKLRWPILLNGRKVGLLELNELPLTTACVVPAGALREGENTLSILSPEAVDDIFIDGIQLDSRPPENALREASLRVRVTDSSTKADGLPCRLTIVDAQGYLAPLYPTQGQSVAARTGVVYTGDGHADIGLPAGSYTVFANRGFEYSVAERVISLAQGQAENIGLEIKREVPTPGFVACDTHIHTLTMSGHGDATTEERMWTLAGEGVELAITTEHNRFADSSEAAHRTKMSDYFTCALGIEVTTKTGHFIAFPASSADAAVPDFNLSDWPALMTSIRSVPGIGVVVLNHPRDKHSGFVPFSEENFNGVTGENKRGAEFSFDAMELINSGALQSDFMQNYRDWFALLNYGYRVTAVGSSDSHDVSRFIVGQGRTYVATKDLNPGRIDIAEASRSFKAGRVAVSLGLLTLLTVDGKFQPGDLASIAGDQININVRVLGPSWTEAEKVELFANGVKIREQSIQGSRGNVDKATLDWNIPKPAHDVHLVAIASGPGVTAPYWAIASPYQPTGRIRNPRVIGSTNPVWIDADNDGKFTSARGYARTLLQRSGTEPESVASAINRYDEAVAAQVASLCQASGQDIRSAAFAEALRSTPAAVQNGFGAFAATLPATNREEKP